MSIESSTNAWHLIRIYEEFKKWGMEWCETGNSGSVFKKGSIQFVTMQLEWSEDGVNLL